MNEQKNNGRGIFYGVIGVATLVVAIIGATFAYFTATASNNVITGNMAQVSLSLDVVKVTDVDISKGGMIPMSNGMIEQAVNKGKTEKDTKGTDNTEDDVDVTNICVDDNGNAVCQIYKITLRNTSSAGQFVDGYVALRGGSGEPTDLTLTTKVKDEATDTDKDGVCEEGETGCEMVPDQVYTYDPLALKNAARETVTYGTTMRWAQVFVDTTKTTGNVTYYTTKGTQTLGAASETVTFTTALGSATDAKDLANIRTQKAYMVPATGTDANNNGICDTGESGCTPGTANPEGVLTSVSISGNYYDAIGTNYIRLSNHKWSADAATPETYDRSADITSALVFNHSIPANTPAEYYVVVWLSETGTNQTAGATVTDTKGTEDTKDDTSITNPAAANFFVGDVTFVSAQGSEVSATFSGYTRVSSQ